MMEETVSEDEPCTCDMCKDLRSLSLDDKEDLDAIQSCWSELTRYLRMIYRYIMKGSSEEELEENYYAYLKCIVAKLSSTCDRLELYYRLEQQVREFVIDSKMRLIQLMEKLTDNPQLPRLFISGMLDHYNKMMTLANEFTPFIEEIEIEHLSKFNLTWKMLIQRMFQTSIYTDTVFQESVPLFITELGKNSDSEENKVLVREFLSFDDEITLVEGMWKEVEEKIQHYILQERKRHEKGGDKSKSKLKIGSQKSGLNGRSCECQVELIDPFLPPSLHTGGFHFFPHLHSNDAEMYHSELPLSPLRSEGKQQNGKLHRNKNLSDNPHSVSQSEVKSGQKRVDKATQKDQAEQATETIAPQTKDKGTSAMATRSVNVKSTSTDAITLHHPHTCLKHSDTIRRIPCAERLADEDGAVHTCSNHEDSHSDSSQPDPRHCDCCYCEVFGHGIPTSAPMSRNYQEIRERLRSLLNKKKSKCKSNSNSPSPHSQIMQKKETQFPNGVTLEKRPSEGDTRDLEDLLDFIEGTVKCRNEKKAAKKARQKEKKQILLEQKLEEERKARRLQEELERRRQEALLETARREKLLLASKNDKENQQGKGKKKNGKNKVQTVKPATKEPPAPTQTSPGPQMVTIKRVMEPHNSEPTVTITLRGATPNQDKVLYTLLNGQVCKVKEFPNGNSKTDKKVEKSIHPNNLSSSNSTIKPKLNETSNISNTTINTNNTSNINKKKAKKDQKGPLDELAVQSIPINARTIFAEPPPKNQNGPLSNALSALKKATPTKPFRIEDLKLPPGITITKVDPSTIQARKAAQEKQPPKKPTPPPPPPPGPTRTPQASEVILVTTGKLKNNNTITPTVKDSLVSVHHHQQNQQFQSQDQLQSQSKKKKNKKKTGATATISQPSPAQIITNGRKTIYPGIDIEPIDTAKIIDQSRSKSTIKKPVVNEAQRQELVPNGVLVGEQGKKKKKKSKKVSLNNSINPEEWKLLDSVFAPKDIDLDDGDMDDDERELEAFKRFCFQSVPPKQKEKVHLNIKDIVLKKKAPFISCS